MFQILFSIFDFFLLQDPEKLINRLQFKFDHEGSEPNLIDFNQFLQVIYRLSKKIQDNPANFIILSLPNDLALH